MLFVPETDSFLRRVQLAADAGFDTIEFWGSDNKNIDAVAEAVARAKVSVSGFSVEPSIALADPANHPRFLDQLATARDTALRLGAGRLIVVAGNKHADVLRAPASC